MEAVAMEEEKRDDPPSEGVTTYRVGGGPPPDGITVLLSGNRAPRDGWIAVRRGQTLLFERQEVNKAQAKLRHRARAVRGTLMAAAYDVENIIDGIIRQFFLKDTHIRDAQSVIFLI
jgi:hypothetical protein